MIKQTAENVFTGPSHLLSATKMLHFPNICSNLANYIITKNAESAEAGDSRVEMVEDEKLIWLKYLSDGSHLTFPASRMYTQKVKRQVNSSHFVDLFH